MSTNQTIDSLLADAADRIKREAYAAGWRDAIQAIKKALENVGDPAGGDDIELGDFNSHISNIDQSLPKIGTTPWHIVRAVKKRPGMTAGDIIETLKASGHSAPETSIRTSIARMKSRDFIVLRHGKWYPA